MSTTSFSAPERDGQRGGGGVGVDVVDLPVLAAGDARDHRDPPVGDQALHDAGLDVHDVADQADVDELAVDQRAAPLGGEQPGVLAGDPDRERAVLVDQPDDVALHLPDQHHPDDVHRLGRGDPQAAAELGVDAEPVEVRGDLRAAAVHDHRAEPDVPEEHHVLGEGAAQVLVDHRVAAVLDHDDLAVEALQPGQRLDQGGGLLPGRGVAGAHEE